ncbi:MAG: hypothetical protein COV37_07295 [Bdellovibrio sp. CG11_big_fil_rev_8_21_14_0_20_39_38]|nr:MAG: hypothetical protein COW78_10905 [Bdellovibrio sp. CG22_combo_CG10-13_8_21_14_all_39_27]PIR35705.1 MAG: hypothetical protein COV37_07295 [Bdellovibrio sp. CG11_big_fil_rev_8_21_14_0_20_39_38]
MDWQEFRLGLKCRMILSTLFALLISSSFAHNGLVEEGFLVRDSNKIFLKHIQRHKDLVVDHMDKKSYEVYGPHGLGTWLESMGADITDLAVIDGLDEKAAGDYPTPEEISDQLLKLSQKFPNIMTLSSIGQTREGRNLWVMKISDNPTVDEVEPEVKYIANMHGNEIVGRELMLKLIEDIGNRYNAGDKDIIELVDNTEVFIMPSMNPDGALKRQRGNGAWKDLNRNFPDFSTQDNRDVPDGREPETKAVMAWQNSRNFSLSANFHGGTKVVNYPWDTTRDPAPLTDLIVELSGEYASKVDGFFNSTEFPGGIVNGNAWYEVDGGMQDWSYYYHNDLQVTIELSHTKWPPYSDIPQYYSENAWSLVRFLKRIHQGLGVKLPDHSPSGKMTLYRLINGQKQKIGDYKISGGEFYKVLNQGVYEVIVTLDSGETKTTRVDVNFDLLRPNGNFLSLWP